MKYYKINTDGIISIATINGSGEGNITEEEYTSILLALKACPQGKVLMEDGELYIYADAPMSNEIPDGDALRIITGGEA